MEQYEKHILMASVALLISLHSGPAKASEGFSFFRSLAFHTGIQADVPMEALSEKEAEELLFAEHTPAELDFARKPPLVRLLSGTELSETGAMRLSLSFLELTGTAVFPGHTAGSIFSPEAAPELSTGWGAALTLSKASLGIPRWVPLSVEVRTGHLTKGGSLSRVRSPFFSAPSAFSAGVPSAGGISAALPAMTSAGGTLSVAASVRPESQVPLVPELCAVLTEDGDWYASASGSLRTKGKALISYGLTGGSFRYERKGSTAWFKGEKPVLPAGRLALQAEASARNLRLPGSVTAGAFMALSLYENPFGGAGGTVRAQLSVSKGELKANAGASFAPVPLFTAGGAAVEERWQLYVNPQYAWGTAGGRVSRAGLSVYAEPSSVTLRALWQLSSAKAALHAGADAVLRAEGLGKVSADVSYTRTFPALSSVTEAGFSRTQAGKITCTLSERISFKAGLVPSVSAGLSLSPAGKTAGEAKTTLSASLRGGTRRIRWTGKVTVRLAF